MIFFLISRAKPRRLRYVVVVCCDIKPTTRFAGLHYRSARTTAQLRRNAKVLALRKRLRKSGYREGRKASATAQLLTTAQAIAQRIRCPRDAFCVQEPDLRRDPTSQGCSQVQTTRRHERVVQSGIPVREGQRGEVRGVCAHTCSSRCASHHLCSPFVLNVLSRGKERGAQGIDT